MIKGKIRYIKPIINLEVQLDGMKREKEVRIEKDPKGTLVQVRIGQKKITKQEIDILQFLREKELIK